MKVKVHVNKYILLDVLVCSIAVYFFLKQLSGPDS